VGTVAAEQRQLWGGPMSTGPIALGGAQLAQWLCATIRETSREVDEQCTQLEHQASQDALHCALAEANHLRQQASALRGSAFVSGAITTTSGALMGSLALQGAGGSGETLQSGTQASRQFETARALGGLASPVNQMGEASSMSAAAAGRRDRAVGDAALREAQQWQEQRQQSQRTEDAATNDLRDITRLAHDTLLTSIGRTG
jgi:hypothetical protein